MITCKFSCQACGVRDAPVRVRARYDAEDVVSYVKNIIGIAVLIEHERLSPNCDSTVMSTLKIPFDEDDPGWYVGKQTNHVPPDDPT